MCGCTLYDSPTCGHSWVSMSQPCGFLSDLLSCPHRQTYQTLIAPPYTCPMCNRGFADQETIEMVQGPWGCNQMLRNHVGGNYAIPGQWGNAPFLTGGYASPAMAGGAMVPYDGMGGAMMPYTNPTPLYDHRLTGPYATQSMAAHMMNGSLVYNDGFDDGYIDHGWDYGSRRGRKQRSKYKYKYTDEPIGNCTVM